MTPALHDLLYFAISGLSGGAVAAFFLRDTERKADRALEIAQRLELWVGYPPAMDDPKRISGALSDAAIDYLIAKRNGQQMRNQPSDGGAGNGA